MARAVRIDDPMPFHQMNVTPFIDVMLVLLVMMILSVSMATHKVPITLPQPGEHAATSQPQLLAIDRAGALRWNGKPVADAEVRPLLTDMQADAGAVLHLQADPETRYARFDAVLAMVKRAGVERLGFVGNRPLEE